MASLAVSGSQWVDEWLCTLCALAWLPAGWTGLEALAAVAAALLLTGRCRSDGGCCPATNHRTAGGHVTGCWQQKVLRYA
jgi:hypothetical protein